MINDFDCQSQPGFDQGIFPDNLTLGDFLEVKSLQQMMDDFYDLTGIGIGILDLESNVLIATGWQDICLNFHRVNAECLNCCVESNIILSASDGSIACKGYKCKNNLWNITTPIIIGGRHMGNIFLGQFFYDDELIDIEFFKKQAFKYNFNEQEYLEALNRVPRWSRKKVETAMRYYAKLAEQISCISFANFQLEHALSTTAKLNISLSDSEEKYRKLFETMSQGVVYQIADGTITDANPAAQEILGLSLDQLNGRKSVDPRWQSIHEDGSDFPGNTHPAIVALQSGKPVNNVVMGVFHPQDSSRRWILINAVPEFRNDESKPYQVCTTFSDITAIKMSEELISRKNEEIDRYFNTSLDMLCIANTQGQFVRLNPEWENVLGYAIQELEGQVFLEYVHPEDLPATLAAISTLGLQEEVLSFENRYRCKDGSYRWIEWRSKPMGSMIYAVARDITARKKMESDLKMSEEKYRSLVNTANEIILVLQDEKICFFNNKTIERSGYSRDELLSKQFHDFIHPDDQPGVMDRYLLRRAGIRTPDSFEFRFVSKNGNIVWVLNNGIDIEWEGRPATLNLLTDITELKETSEALANSESRFREMANLLPQIIFETDLQGNLTFVNQQAYKMMGYKSTDEVIGLSSMVFHMLEERSRVLENIRRKMTGQSLLSSEYNMQRKDGTTFPALVYSNHFFNNGKPAGLRGLIVDITDVKQAQNLLAKANSYLENLFNYANAPIIVWDSEFCITRFNHAFEHITGLSEEEVLGKPLNILFPPDQVESSMEKIRQTQTGQRWETVEIEIQHINQSVRIVLWNSATIFEKDKPTSTIAQGHDITERKKAENALREIKLTYDELVKRIPAGIFTMKMNPDGTGHFVYVSEKFCLMLGLDAQEVLLDPGHFYQKLLPEDYISLINANLGETNDNERINWEGRCMVWGEMGWIRIESETTILPNGNRLRNGVLIDITERKNAEEAFRESVLRFERVVRGTHDGIWEWTIRTKEDYHSPRYKELLGYDMNEIADTTDGFYALVHPDDLQAVINAENDHLYKRVPYDIEFRMRTKQGDYKWIVSRGQAEWDEAGEPLRMSGSITDVSERKYAAEVLKASEEKYRILTENSTDVIWVLNLTKNRFTYISPAIFQLRGLTVEEAQNETMEDSMTAESLKMIHSKLEEKVRQFMDDLRDPLPSVHEIQQPHKDGHLVWVEVATRFQLTGSGELEVVGSSRNIDKRKAIEQELLTAKMQAEAANKAKSEFLANISHEIRTPMNSILGLSEVMLNTTEDATQKPHLKTILDSGKSLLSLINDILDLSKVEAGRIDITPVPADLGVMISDIKSLFQYRLQEKNLAMHIDIDDAFPNSIIIDEIRMRQILLNLIGNAIKFTDHGFVRIEVRTERQYDGLIDFYVAVTDTGIGIKENDLALIFGSFNQQSGQDSRKYGGTGLGLTISKRLCELMDGKISVTSKPGVGSRFVISFNGVAELKKFLPVETAGEVLMSEVVPDKIFRPETQEQITAGLKAEFKRQFEHELIVQTGKMITSDLDELANNLISFAEKNRIIQLKRLSVQLKEYVVNCEFEKIRNSFKNISEMFDI